MYNIAFENELDVRNMPEQQEPVAKKPESQKRQREALEKNGFFVTSSSRFPSHKEQREGDDGESDSSQT